MTTTPSYLRESIKVLADILVYEMSLESGQIMLAYQKWDIPPDNELYFALRCMGPGKVIANVNEVVPNGDGLDEVQSMTIRDLIQLDMMSFSDQARVRKEEVIMALGSIYAQQLEDQYFVQIARNVGDPVDAGKLEGQKYLNRFVYTIPVTSVHTKIKSAPFFASLGASFITEGVATPITFDPTQTPNPAEGI